MRPYTEMRLLALLSIIALLATACGSSGDQPAEEPPPSTTAPGEVTTGSLAYEPAASNEEVGREETSAEELALPATEEEDEPAVEVSSPSEPDPTVVQSPPPSQPIAPDAANPEPDLPEEALNDGWPAHPKYPNTEKVIPPPRD